MEDRLDIGGTFGAAFETFKGNALLFVLLILACAVVTTALDVIAPVGFSLIGRLVIFAIGVTTTGWALRSRCGDEAEIRMRFGAAFGANLLTGLLIGVGLIMLIVPGLIAYAMYAVTLPALLAENIDVEGAMDRSKELSRGHRWQILGIGLMIWVPYFVFLFGVILMEKSFGVAMDLPELARGLINVTTSMVTVLGAIVWSEAYMTLSGARSRLGTLEEIFA